MPIPPLINGDIIGNNVVVHKRLVNDTLITFDDGDTTPSVADSNIFLTANTEATIITAFDDLVPGQKIEIIFGDANTTLANGPGIHLQGKRDFTGGEFSTIKLTSNEDAFCEVSRSVN